MDKDNEEQLIERAVALDLFATAYHLANDSGTFLIGLVCVLVDEIGIEKTATVIAASLAFDKQETNVH